MPKTTGLPPALNLTAARKHDGQSPLSPVLLSSRSTNSPMTPTSPPGSPLLQGPLHHMGDGSNTIRAVHSPASPRAMAMPEFPPSPDRAGSKHGRDASKSFFSNFKASKSSQKLVASETSSTELSEKAQSRTRASSKDRSLYSMKKQGSTHDLPRLIANNSKTSSEGPEPHPESIPLPGSSDGTYKKSKSKLGGLLTRSRNGRADDGNRANRPPAGLSVDTHALHGGVGESEGAALRTAPLKADYRERTFGVENGSANRTRSADRHVNNDVRSLRTQPSTVSSSLPKESSSSLLSNIQQTGRGVGDRLGKAGKGLFSKMTRSGSSTEREIPTEENYVCTTINLPLVRQTRKTRIAKRLELSRDKTEFWMPALPWRCIDYLNMNGCEEEGLYRIPGSGREVKMWQKRFDTEYDINLFEEPELYDINTIGSMFKSWLRELPDEILPKATQNKIAKQCAGATSTPQLLKDELSKLPPFNYYLLFAITCHLSLLHSFAEKNKMDYRNLCICFQPCLKIDAFCFQFLVINWKECWQGCWTEHEYLQEEYRWEREGSVRSGSDHSFDERAISSSGSSHVLPHQPPRVADPGLQRKASMPHLSAKRSMSLGSKGHGNSSSLPSVPQMAHTAGGRATPDQKLPEVGNLSPIRM